MDRLNRMLQAAQGMGMGGGAPGGVSQTIIPISLSVYLLKLLVGRHHWRSISFTLNALKRRGTNGFYSRTHRT
jgi:hypothetical protein